MFLTLYVYLHGKVDVWIPVWDSVAVEGVYLVFIEVIFVFLYYITRVV